MKGHQLFLNLNEARFVAMAVVSTLEQLEESSKDITMPWNPEARKDLREMIQAGRKLASKMKKIGFDMQELPPYIDGEEKDFMTKES